MIAAPKHEFVEPTMPTTYATVSIDSTKLGVHRHATRTRIGETLPANIQFFTMFLPLLCQYVAHEGMLESKAVEAVAPAA